MQPEVTAHGIARVAPLDGASARCALVLLLVFVAAPAVARAQTEKKSAPTRRAAGAATVRERRAAAAKPAAAAAEEKKAEAPSEADAKGAVDDAESASSDSQAEESDAGIVADSGAGAEATREDGEAELEELRAKMRAEKNGVERVRSQREYVERLLELGRRAEAVTELRAMALEERFDPQFFYNVGNALARLGESNAAADAYRKAVTQRRGNYSRAQHNLGVVLMRLGRWEEARDALNAALRLEHGTYAEASYNLGRLHALQGEAGLAINEWTRTLRLRPDHANAAAALARAMTEDGDAEGGLAVLDAFSSRMSRRGASVPREISVTRGEIVAAVNLAAAESRSEVVRRGEAVASESVTRTAATTATTGNRPAGASRQLRALTIDRSGYELLRRARAARDADRHEEAVGLYRQVIRNSGGYFPPANVELGYALGRLKRNEEAAASLLQVTKRDGARYPSVHYHLGRFYEAEHRYGEAAEAYERALALYGDGYPQFLLDVSRAREKEGKPAEALVAMESYVRLTERTGAVPDWAREQVEQLRKKISTVGENK